MYNTPVVGIADATNLSIPDGLKTTADANNAYPVMFWGGNTYWPLSYVDNRYSFGLVVTDSEGYVLSTFELLGGRYIVSIEVDVSTSTIIVHGTSADNVPNQTQAYPWASLIPPPRIVPSIDGTDYVIPYSTTLWMPSGIVPCLRMGGYTYWPMSYVDNRMATIVIATDINDFIVGSYPVPGLRYVQQIQINGSQVEFIGQSGLSGTLSLDSFQLSYQCCFELTAQDFLDMADLFQYSLTADDAAALAAQMGTMSIDQCQAMHNRGDTEGALPNLHPRGFWEATIGTVVGTLVGAAVGFLVADGPGIAAGAFMGAAMGGGIGDKIDIIDTDTRPPYVPQSIEGPQTFIYYGSPLVGPFDNANIVSDLLAYPKFLGYNSGLVAAAALARADPTDPTLVRGYYPTTNSVTNNLDHGNASSGYANNNDDDSIYSNVKQPIWTFIWVIIKVPGVQSNGQNAYQLRFYPETWNVHTGDRPNHSFLTEGYRLTALAGYPDMQVYGAGNFQCDADGRIFAVDARTGHYYRGFIGRDAEVIAAFKDFVGQLGYATQGIGTVGQ